MNEDITLGLIDGEKNGNNHKDQIDSFKDEIYLDQLKNEVVNNDPITQFNKISSNPGQYEHEGRKILIESKDQSIAITMNDKKYLLEKTAGGVIMKMVVGDQLIEVSLQEMNEILTIIDKIINNNTILSETTKNNPVLKEFMAGEPITDLNQLKEVTQKQNNIVIQPYVGVLTDVEWQALTKSTTTTAVRVGMFMKKPLNKSEKTDIAGWGLWEIDGTGKGFGAGSIGLNQKLGKNTTINVGNIATPTTFAHNPFPMSPDGQLVTKTQNLTPIGAPGAIVEQKIKNTTIKGGVFDRGGITEKHISANYTRGDTKVDASVWHAQSLAGALRFENKKILSDLVITKDTIGSDVFINLGKGYKAFIDGVYTMPDKKINSLDIGIQNTMEIKKLNGIIRAVINPITKLVEFRLLVNNK